MSKSATKPRTTPKMIGSFWLDPWPLLPLSVKAWSEGAEPVAVIDCELLVEDDGLVVLIEVGTDELEPVDNCEVWNGNVLLVWLDVSLAVEDAGGLIVRETSEVMDERIDKPAERKELISCRAARFIPATSVT